MADDFSFEGGGLPAGTRVAGFRGTEGLNRCYAFDVFVSTPAALELDLADAIGARGKLAINIEHEAPDRIHGIITELQLVRTIQQASLEFVSLYRIRLAPRVSKLALTRHSRVYTNLSVLELIGKVLAEEGLAPDEYEFRSAGSYPVEAMITQYKESSLDFVHRWMEREGLCYFFEHGDESEKLIIVDDKSQHLPALAGPVRYHPSAGDASAGIHFEDVLIQHTAAPTRVKLADHDYGKPMLDLGSASEVGGKPFGEWNLHAHRYTTPADGARLARLRSEEMRVAALDYEFRGPVPRMRAGTTFELVEHPKASLNGRYVVLEVQHFGKSARTVDAWGEILKQDHKDIYRVHVKGLPAETQYRPPSKTEWPRVDGFESATVDGPVASEYAQIDDQGRYLVKFRFDEGTQGAGKASEYVRMMQPHGGTTEGFHFPLRKGTEVLCAFLGGDVDRPVIIGVVPNALAPSPLVKGNATQNIIQTGSSTSITIEDKKNEQYLNIFCPYKPGENANLYLGIDRPVGAQALTSPNAPEITEQGEYKKGFSNPNFDLRSSGKGQLYSGKSLNVVSDGFMQLDSHDDMVLHAKKWFRHIEHTSTEHLEGTFTQHIDGDVTERWSAKYTLDITGAVKETLQSTLTQNIAWDVDQTYGGKHKLDVAGQQDMTVLGATAHTHDNGLSVTVNKTLSQHHANGNYLLEVRPTANLHATSQFNIRADHRALLRSPETTVKGDSSVVVDGRDVVTIGPKSVTVNGSEVVRLNNDSKTFIEITAGNVTISGGNITINGSGNIREEATGSFLISGKNTAIYGGPVVKVQGGVIKLNCD